MKQKKNATPARRWKIRTKLKLQRKFTSFDPIKLLRRLGDAYIGFMLAFAKNLAQLNTPTLPTS